MQCEVTTDQLFALIGRQQVQIQVLEGQVAQLSQELRKSKAEKNGRLAGVASDQSAESKE